MQIPDSAFRIVAGTPQVSVAFLRDKVPATKRFSQWMQRTHSKLCQAPPEILKCCSDELICGRFPGPTGWLDASDALALLTYSIYSSRNTHLVAAIKEKAGVTLPVANHESTFAGQFFDALSPLLASFWRDTRRYYEIQREKVIGPYRVDSLIVEKSSNTDGSTIIRHYVIEFDEKAHKSKRYRFNDLKRDRWFRKNCPEIKLIRVRHEEQELWLEAISQLRMLKSLEDCYVHCLRTACEPLQSSELLITSQSSQSAYESEHNICWFMLKRPKQRLRELKELLERLGIPCQGGRTIRFKRACLRRYGF
ncbi:hypothetical protein [Candidatus Pantoea soli]|uniref:Uncharacterized protein n=1 Tax=Candidatus Pantoea soli TaxID=3098669 RepID=A0A518XFL3_9GAMM|nr:hypothetical protein [Pantoea soli]QDY43000.1 hypothetical protein D8B20_14420 [Pantoea soli]